MSTSQKKVVTLLGRPCCGKDTQGKKIAETLGCPHIVVSELLRTHGGQQEHSAMTGGALVNDATVNSLVLDVILKEHAGTNLLILNGAGRTVKQMRYLVEKVSLRHGVELLPVLIDIAPGEVLKRSPARGRQDDNVIGRRIKEFNSLTEPAIRWLSENTGIPVEVIDGHHSEDAVFQTIFTRLKPKILV